MHSMERRGEREAKTRSHGRIKRKTTDRTIIHLFIGIPIVGRPHACLVQHCGDGRATGLRERGVQVDGGGRNRVLLSEEVRHVRRRRLPNQGENWIKLGNQITKRTS